MKAVRKRAGSLSVEWGVVLLAVATAGFAAMSSLGRALDVDVAGNATGARSETPSFVSSITTSAQAGIGEVARFVDTTKSLRELGVEPLFKHLRVPEILFGEEVPFTFRESNHAKFINWPTVWGKLFGQEADYFRKTHLSGSITLEGSYVHVDLPLSDVLFRTELVENALTPFDAVRARSRFTLATLDPIELPVTRKGHHLLIGHFDDLFPLERREALHDAMLEADARMPSLSERYRGVKFDPLTSFDTNVDGDFPPAVMDAALLANASLPTEPVDAATALAEIGVARLEAFMDANPTLVEDAVAARVPLTLGTAWSIPFEVAEEFGLTDVPEANAINDAQRIRESRPTPDISAIHLSVLEPEESWVSAFRDFTRDYDRELRRFGWDGSTPESEYLVREP